MSSWADKIYNIPCPHCGNNHKVSIVILDTVIAGIVAFHCQSCGLKIDDIRKDNVRVDDIPETKPSSNIKWSNTSEIAAILYEKYPHAPPEEWTREQFRQKIMELGLGLSEFPPSEMYLMGIKYKVEQMWKGELLT